MSDDETNVGGVIGSIGALLAAAAMAIQRATAEVEKLKKDLQEQPTIDGSASDKAHEDIGAGLKDPE